MVLGGIVLFIVAALLTLSAVAALL